MVKIRNSKSALKDIFMGIDVHERTYSVSVFFENEELLNTSFPSETKHLKRLLERYSAFRVHAVYEAGPFGYALRDWLQSQGVDTMVTPPSKLPQAPGERVKTDQRDARKLAHLLSGGLLRAVPVPERQKREDRDLLRTRTQLVDQRRRIFLQIQSKLRFHGMTIRCRLVVTRKNRELILNYTGISLSLRQSFEYLLNSYDYYTESLKKIRCAVLALSESEAYRNGVRVLKSIPGVGVLTALSFLLEMPEMKAFESNEKVGSYLGLTCSEYSSGESQRQGRITRCGNGRIRGLLVQSAWKLIVGDGAMKHFYERLKRKRGGKRAIIAVARKLSGRMRTVLLRNEPYQLGLAQ
jgi:transposase